MKFLKGNTWKVRNGRLLTNDNPQSKKEQSSVQENLKAPEAKNKLKDITEFSEVHENIKMNTSNSMHAYIKKLEHGYTNKKGLKRLDCHYEKKLFDEMYKLDKIAGHIKSKNSYFKKVILKRYGLRFIVFLIVILFGIAMSILGYIRSINNQNPELKCTKDKTKPCDFCSGIGKVLYIPNSIIYITLVIAFLSFIIYILSKVRKYKNLKRKYDKKI